MKDTFFYSKKTLNLRGKVIDLSTPKVMGILNVTPDSFFDGGKYSSENAALKRAEEIISEGGDIIDLGGYSTRPGAQEVEESEEIDRVIPIVKAIVKRFPEAIISIDTFRSKVAREAVEEGALIVNDVSGGTLDSFMFETVAKLKVPYILMHMKGTPKTMGKLASYDNVVEELIHYFQDKIKQLQELGVEEIILDPGFGFAKTVEHNYKLLQQLNYFKIFNLPILVGISRKSMISKGLNISPENTLNGTTVLNSFALMNGAGILRVHDVKECAEVVKLYKLLNA